MSKQIFISFSGGVESTEMLRRYGKGAKGIVCDTGDEELEMYERWDFVENAMKIIHNGDFELIRIKPCQNAKGKQVDNLNDYAMQYGYYASPQARYCTKFFKIIPIDNFLKEQGECVLMIGLNADEENTRDGNFEQVLTVDYQYPLITDGITRQDCIDNLTAFGLQPLAYSLIFLHTCSGAGAVNASSGERRKPKQNIFLIRLHF